MGGRETEGGARERERKEGREKGMSYPDTCPVQVVIWLDGLFTFKWTFLHYTHTRIT